MSNSQSDRRHKYCQIFNIEDARNRELFASKRRSIATLYVDGIDANQQGYLL